VPSVPFITPTLKGTRFEGHSIPLEFLNDLAVLEEMVIEVAKWKFLEANPERKRIRRKFTEGVSLNLTSVDEGSAKAVISLTVMAVASLFPSDVQVHLEDARDAIVQAIGAAERNEKVSSWLPEKFLGYFDRFGRSLRDNESIEFESVGNSPPTRLTKEIRRKLLLSSSQVNEVTEEVTIRGTIPEADQQAMTCTIQFTTGELIQAPIAPQHFDKIMEGFNGFKSGQKVQIQGIAKLNRNERIQRFDSIEHIVILDPLDVTERLNELSKLEDGWLEGDGFAPIQSGLEWLTLAFDTYYPPDSPLPYVYPTPEGNIRAEWSIGSNEISLEVDLVTHVADYHILDLATDREASDTLNLETESGWQSLASKIEEIVRQLA
jgi:hypothetical protein